ncbi:MAG TPA: hypothetical protein VFP17_03950, partial [Solirubrobacterales bacterium]|nr:hypothetical protein [Solirubrobacterales bacterium]
EVHPGRYLLAIELPESDGWQMGIAASGHDEVELTATRGAASVAYRAPGRVSSQRVEADFGALGRIDLKLDLEARGTGVPRLHGRCTGRSPYELVGSFHGTVDFSGEPNVAGVSADRGHATIRRSFQHVCQPLELPGLGKKPIPLETDVVAAQSHENGRTTEMAAIGIDLFHEFFLGLITGSVSERAGTVKITRSRKGLIFEEKELHLSKPGAEPERAKVKPSWPFRGSGFFVKPNGEPAQWEGNLNVQVPGGGRLALAGPNFNGTLCRAHVIDELSDCASRLQGLRGPAASVLDLYGSGSHSQPLAPARLSSLR